MNRARVLTIILFFWILAGCNLYTAPDPTLTYPLAPISTKTQTPLMTIAPVETVTPSITPTPTPTPNSIKFIHTSLDSPGEWEIGLPYIDQNLPQIIIDSPEGKYLDPSFDVSTIEMSYEWWGLGDPVLEFQRIERKENNYWLGDKVIGNNLIESLIKSINHLHPEPYMLNSTTHTDDYPIWTLELSSYDGVHLLVYSNSNTPDYSPWNVVYNGQIYSQFDGQINEALAELFAPEEGKPGAWTWVGEVEEGYLSVTTIGLPSQMVNGFNGILAFQNGFNYWVDAETGLLSGYFEGRSSIGGMGHMIIGSITQLDKIEIDIDENVTITCSIEAQKSDDPSAYGWGFTCPMEEVSHNSQYYYPIRVSFTTDKNKSYTVNGNLFGNWKTNIQLPYIALPEEIDTILRTSNDVNDLLENHQLAAIKYDGAVDKNSGQMTHEWNGEIVLLGQADIGGRIQKYSITLQVRIKDSGLIQWDLDREELISLLEEVLNQPISKRFLEADPNLVLNLYYGEGDIPILSDFDLPNCADIPVSPGLPTISQPLHGFAFNQSWSFNGMQIILIKGESRISNLDIRTYLPEHSTWTSLLPKDLIPINAPMFARINTWSWSPDVVVEWDKESDTNSLDIYKEMAKAWNGSTEVTGWGIMFNSAMLGITDDGKLELISCGEIP